MQNQLVELAEAKTACGFKGSQAEFKKSKELIDYCIKNRKIVRVTSPTQLNLEHFHEYHKHLLKLARAFVREKKLRTWDELQNHAETTKVAKILHEFGVRSELFQNEVDEEVEDPGVTLTQIWEAAKVHYGFKGSEGSFKRWLQERYGSVAEYCLAKGLPINATKWESHETAIRVAKKLGSLNEIRAKSKSLYKYLDSEDLISKLKLPESSVDHLIVQLIKGIWTNSDYQEQVIKKWYIETSLLKTISGAEKANISLVADELAKLLTGEELGLLYYDIGLIFDESGDPSDFEKSITSTLDKSWRAIMYPYAEQAMRFRRSPFVPHSVVSAIGYILFQAVSVDGHIHVDEVLELKRGLTAWHDLGARKILAAVNFCLHGSSDESILGLGEVLKLQTKSKQSVSNCCKYLIENADSKLTSALLTHVDRIITADGVTHDNEKWLIDTLKKELTVKQKAS